MMSLVDPPTNIERDIFNMVCVKTYPTNKEKERTIYRRGNVETRRKCVKHREESARFGFYTVLALTQLQMCKCVRLLSASVLRFICLQRRAGIDVSFALQP